MCGGLVRRAQRTALVKVMRAVFFRYRLALPIKKANIGKSRYDHKPCQGDAGHINVERSGNPIRYSDDFPKRENNRRKTGQAPASGQEEIPSIGRDRFKGPAPREFFSSLCL